MAEEEVKQGKVEEVTEVTPLPEATPRTYSQEEVDALIATREEVAAETARKAEFDRINPILSQQGADLKRLREQPLSKRSSADKIHLAEMEAREKDTGETNPRIAQLKAEIAKEEKLEAEAEQARISSLQENIDGYRQRAEALGLTEEDEDYWSIKSLVERGEYKPAEIKLKKLETAKKEKPVETKPKETEDEKVNRLVEEKLRAKMEEKGMLSSDTGLPSGAGSSDVEFERKMGSGELPMTPENIKRAQEILDKRQRGG